MSRVDGSLAGMREVERRLSDAAASQRFLIARGQALALGATERYIDYWVTSGRWQPVHSGVYQLDGRPRDWESELMAAILACGNRALASHRAAMRLWDLDGIGSSPLELTVPFGNLPIPDGVLVHRTRRAREIAVVKGIPVTTIERTLLDCASVLPRLILAKALESALRRRLTTLEQVSELIGRKGGRGVKGTKKLRWVLRERVNETSTDSGSETELLYHMRLAGVPEPVLQRELFSMGGERMLPDFYWPDLEKAVEVDGVDAHDSAERLDRDLKRQNALMDLGIEVRRFSAREVRRNPRGVVDEIRRFLAY